MAIFAIGDMHLSLGTDKPMDVFPGWEGYLPRLEASWRKLIGPDDTVVGGKDDVFRPQLPMKGPPGQ